MFHLRWLVAAAAAVVLAGGASSMHAQGVTTGAVGGFVTDSAGQPVSDAQVRIVNRATGFTTGTVTRENGRFLVTGLEPGSQYAVEARRIGFAPGIVEGVQITIGQSSRINIVLRAQATQLGAVTVTASAEQEAFAPTRAGVSTTISDSALRRLPSLNRNFTDFVALTPQVSTTLPNGGLSGGGVNNRFNHIQIDGASETDLFGLGSTGQPGGQAQGKSIAIESVKQYQVLLTPFDVRQGNFAGLLVNAVTKSGTNQLRGSVYGFGRNNDLTRTQPYITTYEQGQYGFSLGGPAMKDRVHFFVNPEWQKQSEPARGPFLGAPGSSLSAGDVTRFQNVLEGYGITGTGSAGAVTNENPLANFFGRVDVQLPFNNTLVLRHNYGHAERDVFSRGSLGSSPDFPLTSNGYKFKSIKNATVAQLRTRFDGGVFNEVIVGFNTIRDRRAPLSPFPQVQVFVPGATLYAGAERFSHGNELDQDILEVTENLTIPVGAHSITIGGQANFYRARNLFRQSSLGVWRFGSLDSLELGLANQYIVGVPAVGDGSVRFRAAVYAGYIQDQWTVSPRLTLTGGVRFDVPSFNDRPPVNTALREALGYNTADIPSGNLQLSPRFSFNWDITGDQRNQLRGGIGAFTGHPAYVWLSNAFQNSGLTGVAVLTCNNSSTVWRTPQFNPANIAAPPTQCADGQQATASSEINLLDPELRFPQTGRASLGYDRDLGNNLVLTLEGLYTVGIYAPFYENVALAGPQGVDAQGRVMYGPRPNNPVATSSRTQIFRARNSEWEDRAFNLTAGLKRKYADNWEGSLFYTYSQVRDVVSLTSSTAFSQTRFGRVWAGNLSDTRATRSAFEQPHRVVLSGSYTYPRTSTTLSLIYTGESGTPFTYVSSGDLNANGFTMDDPIYVPYHASQIIFQSYKRADGSTVTPAMQMTAFEHFINDTECLSSQRGRIMERNSCRAPWRNMVNLSLRQGFNTFRTQNVSVQLDVFNFLNLLNNEWGRQTFIFPQVTALSYRGLTSSSGTLYAGGGASPIYTFDVDQQRFNFDNIDSNYQIQLSARYSF